LEHLYDPQKAVNEIFRVLKLGGKCILSTRFIHPYHPGPKDYYRFTWDSLRYLFKDFKRIEIYHHGNKFQSIWNIITNSKLKVFLNIFNFAVAKMKSKDTKFPCGFVIYAEK